MKHIGTNQRIDITWEITRGSSGLREDFRRASLFVFLIRDREQVPLVYTLEGNLIKATLPEGLDEGVYGLLALWFKPGSHPYGLPVRNNLPPCGRMLRSQIDDVVGLTALAEEEEFSETSRVEVTLRSSVATYGYDGLSAYELAVILGLTSLPLSEWVANLGEMNERIQEVEDAETARQSAEKQRVAAETGRQSAEEARASAESERQKDEGARQKNEAGRMLSEFQRASAEKKREDNEAGRAKAEEARQKNEAARRENEEGRTKAEEARVSAEKKREEFLTGVGDDIRENRADIDRLLDKVFPLSVSLSTPVTLFRKGTSQDVVFSVTVKRGDDKVVPDALYFRGDTQAELDSKTSLKMELTATTEVFVSARVGGSIVKSKTVQVSFVPLSYSGAVSPSWTATEAGVKALTPALAGSRQRTVTLSLSNQKVAVAYPKEFGAATGIKDANGFDYLASYTRSEVEVDGEAYYVYLLTGAATISGFVQTFY